MTRSTFVLMILAFAPTVDADEPDANLFDKTIAPLFATRCLECHSGPQPKGGLDLSHRDKARAGGESGPAIVAGKLDKSLMWKRISADEMPPKHPLSENEKTLLKTWIAGGAEWGTPSIDRFRYTTDHRGGYDWWSLQPLGSAEPPSVKRSDWPRNAIDNFVLSKLEQGGSEPSAEANPRVLVRRLYFDLLGLPPSPDEVSKFAADPSDAAYRKMVDRLLQSPHYGQRWGRHWLDVVRFGESDGFERNGPRKNFWHYRDWVIDAFNNDLPYDRFVRMQLAGDVLQPGREGSAAVGFFVAGVHNTVVGSSERMRLLARQDELEEIIGAVGQTFLGLTINCARCHDHKFDPIRNTEYYQMIASIDGVRHGERDVTGRDTGKELAAIDLRIAGISKSLAAIESAARESVLAERKKNGKAATVPERPQPCAAWEFETDLKDSIGKLHGKAIGGARLDSGALVLDGRGAFVQTEALDRDLTEKTLEAWVILDNLNQRGGGAISVETNNGGVFDAIVFGEREPQRWMAGSNGFVRTKSFQATEEQQANSKPVHVAIVYHADGTITGYRNGAPYGQPYKTGFQSYKAGQAHVVFGMRHAPAGSNKMLTGRILRANLYDTALGADAVAASAGVESSYVTEAAIIAALTSEKQKQRTELEEQLAALQSERDKLQREAKTKIYTVLPRNPGTMRVHIRGSVTNFGDEVVPGGIGSIVGVSGDFGLAKDASDADRRKKLADWITNASNPLFRRVIVNRVWHYHFGTGIVETPSDLGFNGGRPSHRELLDWLAGNFQENGLRLKSLHRLIVMSATYRQSSTPNADAIAKDAGNRLLWRYSPRRIEAEALRDALLDIAGVLNPARGGPGFEDVQSTPNNGTTYYTPIDPVGSQFDRRTVYRFTPRGGRSPILDTFDCPDPSGAAPRRSVTTTPLQALSLLNNSFVLRMADHFAQRVKQESAKDTASQVRRVWQLALCRMPDADEEQLSVQLVSKHGLPTLCRALFNSNEFVMIE